MVEVPEKAKLAFACAGIFLSFSYFAVLQEDVYKKPYGGEYFKYTFLALVCERGINAAIGAMGVLCLGGSGLKIPLLDILWSGTSQMFAMAGSNEALRYVSYPTQVRPLLRPHPRPAALSASTPAHRHRHRHRHRPQHPRLVPHQVLGKSCKMVPVMAGGIVLGGKSYGFFEYLQVSRR